MVRFLEGLIRALKEFTSHLIAATEAFIKAVVEFFGDIVTFLVELLEAIYEWLTEIVQAIFEYLVRFFSALFNLLIVSGQLILFYVPSIGMVSYYFFVDSHWGWLVGAIAWAVLITLAGLFYRE